jgi:hypothetical protein
MGDALKELIAERDRLDRAIAVLEVTAPRRGRPPGSGNKASVRASKGTAKKKRGRPPMTAAQREAASKRMKKYWAAKRKAGKKQ